MCSRRTNPARCLERRLDGNDSFSTIQNSVPSNPFNGYRFDAVTGTIAAMLNLCEIMTDACLQRLCAGFREHAPPEKPEYESLIAKAGRDALCKLAYTDAPYHDLEHTIHVTLAGQAILIGKQRSKGDVSCEDWLHTVLALLYHDIGFVSTLR